MLLTYLLGSAGPIGLEIAAGIIDKAILTGTLSAISKFPKIKEQFNKSMSENEPNAKDPM